MTYVLLLLTRQKSKIDLLDLIQGHAGDFTATNREYRVGRAKGKIICLGLICPLWTATKVLSLVKVSQPKSSSSEPIPFKYGIGNRISWECIERMRQEGSGCRDSVSTHGWEIQIKEHLRGGQDA